MGAPVIDISIVKGKTFEFMYRYAEHELVYLPIAAMPNTAPVRLTITNHGIPDGWPVRIEGVRQPVELNSADDAYYIATSINADTIELNTVRADQWRAFTAGGLVILNRPFDLTSCAARMQIRDRVDGKMLLSFSSDPFATPVPDGSITVDVELAALIVRLNASKTTDIEWTRAVYDLELTTPDGGVYPVTAVSKVTVGEEVTR
ncbi:hypothetical protein LCG56_26990 [Pseudomonas cannabina pv. alisalensis]|uniref:Uncharacterized protein n=1 Tax=Pseudomonas syringae pv. maculicola str. ES4326 TaxID=629265 RepID=A0A8T8C0F0_PSEYM|nr:MULTISPECIES: hypothetical protein [Pseudomonas syringae group]QHE96874.1 hypothetical protein PMA4326_009710 [Pseudomonas syringae pv. maculicola str. ES4326]UBY97533.1 hypothetical protein LCG56_26990 [Pseudomonas cannabina pv. alisalensis]